jgi:hypothetical protein
MTIMATTAMPPLLSRRRTRYRQVSGSATGRVLMTAENKTMATGASVRGYVAAIDDDTRRKDCEALVRLMTKATKNPPVMWGASIVGFGSHHYRYESGREGDACLVGFSSRKGDISLYGLNAAVDAKELLEKLGKHKAGKGCVYIRTLADVDLKVLARLVAGAAARKKRQHD